MIATVRIAPVERWCTEVLDQARSVGKDGAEIAGRFVKILTQSVRQAQANPCDGREWLIESECADELRSITVGNYPQQLTWICEHMLEMD